MFSGRNNASLEFIQWRWGSKVPHPAAIYIRENLWAAVQTTSVESTPEIKWGQVYLTKEIKSYPTPQQGINWVQRRGDLPTDPNDLHTDCRWNQHFCCRQVKSDPVTHQNKKTLQKHDMRPPITVCQTASESALNFLHSQENNPQPIKWSEDFAFLLKCSSVIMKRNLSYQGCGLQSSTSVREKRKTKWQSVTFKFQSQSKKMKTGWLIFTFKHIY